MTDPKDGGLYAGHQRNKRKAELEDHLRNAFFTFPMDPDERELYQAIREVAIPALDELRLAKKRMRTILFTALPKGRPRKDALANETAQLKKLGLSYAQIALRLNQKFGEGTATKESVRKLLKSRKPKSAHGAAPPPDKSSR